MSKLSISVGKAFLLSILAVATSASKSNSNLTDSYNATNKAVIHITESMNNEKIKEIKSSIDNNYKHYNKSKEFVLFITEISSEISELNDAVNDLLVLLNQVGIGFSVSKKHKAFFAKQVENSAEMYAQYVDSLDNILSIKRELNVKLKDSEKLTLRKMHLIKNGLRDISISVKNMGLS